MYSSRMRPVMWPLMVLGLLLDGAAGACVSAWVAPLPLLQRSAGHRTWPGAGDGAAALSMLSYGRDRITSISGTPSTTVEADAGESKVEAEVKVEAEAEKGNADDDDDDTRILPCCISPSLLKYCSTNLHESRCATCE